MTAAYSFTEHWNSIKDPDIELEVRGKTFTLPASLPVSFWFMGADGEMSAMDADYNVLCQLFGQENVDEWIGGAMSTKEYKELLVYIGNLYSPEIIGEDGEVVDSDPKEVTSS